jgi:hypothetical protein
VNYYSAYPDYLEVHQDEFAQLFNAMLINVTAFFRDADAFEYLRTTAVPKVIAASTGGDIRIWSASCTLGEECYSVAILFAEAMGPEPFRERVKITRPTSTKKHWPPRGRRPMPIAKSRMSPRISAQICGDQRVDAQIHAMNVGGVRFACMSSA